MRQFSAIGPSKPPPHVVAPLLPDLQSPPQQPRQQGRSSSWHSPVPYLFGGLTAMLGLIAFALLLLACSYWKLSGYLDGGDARDEERGLETTTATVGEKPPFEGGPGMPASFQEKVVVIMAGDSNPTFLATPMTSRACSFGDDGESNDGAGHREEKKQDDDYDDDGHNDGEKEEGKELAKHGCGSKGSIQISHQQ